MGIQALYSGVLKPHPARVTRLHHRWGAIKEEIFVSKYLNHGPRSLMAVNVTTRL